ncbi:malonyl-CoA:anthocyanidin 5-O-glucoside-6''-O-malonyltransferase-like [Phragmites australis]|uniref:malonyl-CoA:anthocyanidin 5-O-glucoside-6''-O-malonyltransferase-like n=1 Tax=Phragmites australis TaxID=29695 RepID=UPI002D77F276|nr:malonyl-CoA:anthocyanidin 5-O-glucoside-6''-O-malonyltransferase-like [Phragmites australis]
MALPQLRVLHTALLTPSPASPALPPRSLPLTFFDVKWLHLPPVERLFLYRLAPDADVPAILSALKDSLSRALGAFYPLAGHVRLTPGTTHNRYDLFYQPGDAVPFTAAEYDVDIDDLASDDPVKVAKIASLVPDLPKGRAVLAVQATLLLPGHRGLALGVTVHHSACDGTSSTHFLHTWAAACAGAEPPPPPPVIDRALIPDPGGLYDIYMKSLPPMISNGDEFEFASKKPVVDDKLLATFTLPQQLLESIKGAVAREASRRCLPPPRCSSLLATYSFIWSCYCRAREPTPRGEKRKSYFLFSVDQRARLRPAVPEKYLGNCLCPAIAIAAEDEVAAAGAGGLFAACAAAAAAVEDEVGEGAQGRWDGSVARVKEAVANGTLSVAGSPRFRVYDVDFGFGRPVKVDIVSVANTGAISVTEGRGGSGGMEVGISMPADAMDRFRRCFADAIASLSPLRAP